MSNITCIFCKHEIKPSDHYDYIVTILFPCFNCITNNSMFSFIKDRFILNNDVYHNGYDSICSFQLSKLTKINNPTNLQVEYFDYANCRAFNINSTIYVTTDIYTVYINTPKEIIVDSNIPVQYDHGFYTNQFNTNIDFIQQIKACKNPEDAVNTINTLLLFN